MAHLVELGTVRILRDERLVSIEEVFEPSLVGKIFGALGAFAFLAASLFFWFVPAGNPDTTALVIRIILCGGFLLIGIVLARGALIPRTKVDRLEFDLEKRQMLVVQVHDSGTRDVKHTVPFGSIERFYAGSQGQLSANPGGSTVLYMEAESGPRNGVLIVGSVGELEEFAREANTILEQKPKASPKPTTRQRKVFGKRTS